MRRRPSSAYTRCTIAGSAFQPLCCHNATVALRFWLTEQELSHRELLPQLDGARFWQVHRSLVVRADAIASARRDETGKLIPIDVQTGDRVLFGKWSGTEVKINGIEYLIMKESDIMGVITDGAAKKKAA